MTFPSPTADPTSDSFIEKLKQFFFVILTGKDLDDERKKKEMTQVLKAMKEEKQKVNEK